MLAHVVTGDYILNMRTVGVRELKAHLSSVLREVQRGEVVLVTDRGRVVAELRQPDSSGSTHSRFSSAYARLAASGHLRVSERRDTYPASPLKSRAGLARALLAEDRDER